MAERSEWFTEESESQRSEQKMDKAFGAERIKVRERARRSTPYF